jgi:hypothetical protein
LNKRNLTPSYDRDGGELPLKKWAAQIFIIFLQWRQSHLGQVLSGGDSSYHVLHNAYQREANMALVMDRMLLKLDLISLCDCCECVTGKRERWRGRGLLWMLTCVMNFWIVVFYFCDNS